MRVNVSSGNPYEEKNGYCRAVRVGPLIEVAGTVAADENGKAVGTNLYEQCCYIFEEKIFPALKALNADYTDVIRTRIFVTNIDDADEAGKAHHKYFSTIRPACTLMEISRLVPGGFLVEIEVTAYTLANWPDEFAG